MSNHPPMQRKIDCATLEMRNLRLEALRGARIRLFFRSAQCLGVRFGSAGIFATP